MRIVVHDSRGSARSQYFGPICRGKAYSAPVDEALLNELRVLGATTASPPGVHERDTVAARVDALLLDPDDPDPATSSSLGRADGDPRPDGRDAVGRPFAPFAPARRCAALGDPDRDMPVSCTSTHARL